MILWGYIYIYGLHFMPYCVDKTYAYDIKLNAYVLDRCPLSCKINGPWVREFQFLT